MLQQNERTQVWQQLVGQVREEYARLDEQERVWIAAACHQISRLQAELDLLFREADGLKQCQDCRGDCCALGHNHLSLANLLLFLSRDIELPELDFSASCPLLGRQGCALSAEQRPYNCISFLCDRIEGQLSLQKIELFYRYERELRGLYRSFAERYTGGSMSGLLLAARRLQGQPFLKKLADSRVVTSQAGCESLIPPERSI